MKVSISNRKQIKSSILSIIYYEGISNLDRLTRMVNILTLNPNIHLNSLELKTLLERFTYKDHPLFISVGVDEYTIHPNVFLFMSLRDKEDFLKNVYE